MKTAALADRLIARLGRAVDGLRGLDTATWVTAREIGFDPAERTPYVPSNWLALWAALPRSEVRETDVLADLGAGKGRIVVEAARRYPLRRVIGVEYSAELTAIARRNLAANRHRLRCRDVELVTCDVTRWSPPDDLTIAYLFNPFSGSVFSAALQRLVELVDRRGTPLRIIYVNAKEHDRVMATGRAIETAPPSRLRTRLAGLPDGWVRRYELRPSRSRAAPRRPGPVRVRARA